MHINSSKTKFTFGPYKGKTFEYIIKKDPAYIEQCMLNLQDFSIDENVLSYVRKDNKIKYKFSDDAIFKNEDKQNDESTFFENDFLYKSDMESKSDYNDDYFEIDEDPT